MRKAEEAGINVRYMDKDKIAISINETTTLNDLIELAHLLCEKTNLQREFESVVDELGGSYRIPKSMQRKTSFMTQAIFNQQHSETTMLRYLKTLEKKDLSLADAMIPLGSCTMKLNSTTEMMPVTWPSLNSLHPFAPADQTSGYSILIEELEHALADITGLPGVSLQPNR